MTGWTAMFANPFAQRLGWALSAFLWQGALVAAALASVNVMLRHRDARLRYAVCCAALFTMLLLPVATFARRGGQRDLAADPASGPAPAASIADSGLGNQGANGLPDFSVFRMLEERLRQRLAAVQPWFVAGWLAGVAVFSARLLSGWAAVRRLCREAVPAPAWLETALARLARRLRVCRPVRLLESAAVAVPSVLGAWRPILLLPVSAVMRLTPDQLEAVLAHDSLTSGVTTTWSIFSRPSPRRCFSTIRPSGGFRARSASNARTAAMIWPSRPPGTRGSTLVRSTTSRGSVAPRPNWPSPRAEEARCGTGSAASSPLMGLPRKALRVGWPARSL